MIDNFENINKQRTWEGEGQRYWLNKQFWGGNGYPIFVFIGGEGQESCSRLTNRMYVYDLAKEHKALMVNVEHRYYGESYPTTDMSTENLGKILVHKAFNSYGTIYVYSASCASYNSFISIVTSFFPMLGYLSSQQALADLTRIINHITSSLETTNSRIITVGGSYPGNLAAWFKLKYPQVSSGSIASSAPLNAETNFYQYMEVVANSIAYFSGDECNKALEQAALEVAKFAKEGPNSDGYKKLGTDFATCSPMKNVADLSILLSDLMGNIQGTIQYNNEHNGVMNVTDICAVMTSGTDYYNQFVELSAKFRTANGQACEDASWEDTVAYLSNPEYDPNNAARPWTYQTCNEFGYFQTTDSPKQPFYSWTVLNDNFYRQLCSAAFNGWKSDPEVEWINEVYGSTDIAGTDIIFPSGTIGNS